MSLFQCDKCGCVENTSCTDGYWWMSYLNISKDQKNIEAAKRAKEELGLSDDEPLGHYCSVCSPISFNGLIHSWHNRFPREYLPKGEWQTDNEGNLEHKITKAKNFEDYLKDTEYLDYWKGH